MKSRLVFTDHVHNHSLRLINQTTFKPKFRIGGVDDETLLIRREAGEYKLTVDYQGKRTSEILFTRGLPRKVTVHVNDRNEEHSLLKEFSFIAYFLYKIYGF
ncbi:hypothetical protein [Aureibacillus halotolerans]|uniref:Uncharacterized protein n=1 Tax=Aureibacillus halotolerans TaxID=1508390 RepID=A0A4R6TXW9_9BACI|nr:hypothetical protein [Aureibacillus halotolerans]TDQ37642.1 hypothetical protein EV213_1121 [Aureibacillus halotolerans]